MMVKGAGAHLPPTIQEGHDSVTFDSEDINAKSVSSQSLPMKFHAIISAVVDGRLEDLNYHVRYDVVDHNLILSQGDGLPGVKFWARTMGEVFSDLSATIADTIVEGNKLAARVCWAGTHSGTFLGVPATHHYVEIESFYILHFEEGLVVQWWDGSDTRQQLRQAGATVVLPQPTY